MSTSTTPAGDGNLQLQIKDAGTWRNIVKFSKENKTGVLVASTMLIRSLQQPQSSMRVIQGANPLYFCGGPSFMWVLAGDAGRASAGVQEPDQQHEAIIGDRAPADEGCPHSLRHATMFAPHAPAPSRPGTATDGAPADPAADECALCGDTGTSFGKVCDCVRAGR